MRAYLKPDCLLVFSKNEVPSGILVSPQKRAWIVPFRFETLPSIKTHFKDYYKVAKALIEERKHIVPDEKIYDSRLYRFQNKGVSFCLKSLEINRGVILADEMGLGKTIQALIVMRELGSKKVLVICPNLVKLNWAEEAKKWLGVEFDIDEPLSEKLIINYEKLLNPIFQKCLLEKNWDLIIFDEAHRVKNVKAKRTKVAQKLARNAKKILLLTGTPCYNRPDDLYSLFSLCSPGRFPQKKEFVDRYLKVRKLKFKTKTGKQIEVEKVVGIKDLYTFRLETRDLLIRREVEEVLKDLPKKRVVNIWVDLEEEQKKLYKEAEDYAILKLKEETLDLTNALVLFNRLKALAISPYLLEESKDYEYSPKVDALIDLFEDAEEKIVVVTKFKRAVKLTQKILQKRGIETYTLTGEDKVKDRLLKLRDFERNREPSILVGTIDCLSEGINLQYATHIICFLDLDFSPSKNEQQEDRIRRLGQVKKPLIVRILSKAPIDVYTLVLLKEKKSLADEILKKRAVWGLTKAKV